MSLDQRVLGVIETLYDAAMDDTRWRQALKELTDLTGSQGASFWVLDAADQSLLPTFITINFDPKFIDEYLAHMAPIDPTVQYLVRHPTQPIVHDGLVISERDKDRHPYYDWHGRGSDTRFRLVGQVRPAPDLQAGVALHRTRAAGRYESRDIEKFAVVHNHLERALTIGFRLGSLGTLQRCTTDLLDRNPAAILLLDEDQRIVYSNRRADALRSDGDGIRLAADRITALNKRDNETLQSLIAQVLSGIALHDAPGGSLRAQRPSRRRPYAILVAPVSRRYPVLSTLRPAVCVVINDPDAERSLPNDPLQTTFGLTKAEARLAVLLATGEDLRSAATKLGITYGTARVRLAEIFQKTDTRRQGQLITLLLTTLAMI